MRRALCLSGLLLMLAWAPAHARTVTIGSDLTAEAATFQSAPVDSAYWNTKLASGGRVTSPVRGEVSRVRLKGRINRSTLTRKRPDVVMHFQVLRPVRGGQVEAIVTTGNLKLPFGGGRNRLTTFNLQSMPARICVRRGDHVALSTSGGFGPGYPDGAGFQMFGPVAGSAFRAFTGAGKDMDGDVFRGAERSDQELLLQATIATGRDARPFCR